MHELSHLVDDLPMIRIAFVAFSVLLLTACSGSASCAAPEILEMPTAIRAGQSRTLRVQHLIAECGDMGAGTPPALQGTVEIELMTDEDGTRPIATFTTTEVSSEAEATVTVEIPQDAPTGGANLLYDGTVIGRFTIT